jgi:hypothetical protein
MGRPYGARHHGAGDPDNRIRSQEGLMDYDDDEFGRSPKWNVLASIALVWVLIGVIVILWVAIS